MHLSTEAIVRSIINPSRNCAKEWRSWRKERGWTQREMADVLGVSLRTVRNVELGWHPPCLSSRLKMEELQKRYREARELENYGIRDASCSTATQRGGNPKRDSLPHFS